MTTCPTCGHPVEHSTLAEVRNNQLGVSGASDPATSRAAAVLNFPRSGNQRYRVLMAIAEAGERGRTYVELERGIPMYSAQRRLHDLKKGGWVEPNGDKRRTPTGALAEVYVLTDKARRAIAAERGAKGQETRDLLSVSTPLAEHDPEQLF